MVAQEGAPFGPYLCQFEGGINGPSLAGIVWEGRRVIDTAAALL